MSADEIRSVTRALSQQRSRNNSHHSTASENSKKSEVNENEVWSEFDAQSDAISTIQSLLSALNPPTDIETALITAVKFLANSHSKLRSDYKILAAKIDSVSKVADANTVTSEQALQYTRRDTVIVTGLPYTAEERPEELQKSVASVFSSCGVAVTSQDFSAYHRNGKTTKTKTN